MSRQPDGSVRRVAIVLAQDANGGSESQARLLARGLRERGVGVTFFVVAGPIRDAGSRDLGASLLSRRSGVTGAVVATFALRRHIRKDRYDAVLAIMAKAYVITPVAALGTQTRVVAWRRNLGIHSRHSRVLRLVEKFSAALSDAIACNSEAVRDYWRSEGFAAAKLVIVPNQLDEHFAGAVDGQTAPPPTGPADLLAVGGLKAVKGHDLLLEAAGGLVDDAGSRPRVRVVGEGEMRPTLEQMARRLDVDLDLPGHTSDVLPYLRSCRVFVQASHSEGASNALIEAMSQGCAIVATDVGGTRELLADAGLLVPPGSVKHLRQAISSLVTDAALRAELGQRARARSLSRHRPDVVVGAHLGVLAGDVVVEP